MSQTSSLAKVPTSSTDTNVDHYVIDKSKLKESEPLNPAPANTAVQSYILRDGDTYIPVFVEVRIQRDNLSRANPQVRHTVKLLTHELVDDTVTEIEAIAGPVDAGIYFNLPLGHRVSSSDIMKLLSSVYFLLCGTVTAGVPDSTYVDRLLYGQPDIYE